MKKDMNINWQNLINDKEGETFIKKKSYTLEGRYKYYKMGTDAQETIKDCKVDKVRGKATYVFQKGLHETIDDMIDKIEKLKGRKKREIVEQVSDFYIERDTDWFLNATSFSNQSKDFSDWWDSTSVGKDLYKRAFSPDKGKGSDPTKSILGDKPVTYQNIFDLKTEEIQKIADYLGVSGRGFSGMDIKKETWVNNILKKYKENEKK